MIRRRVTTPYAQLNINATSGKSAAIGCLVVAVLFCGYAWFAGIVFQYALWSILAKDVPFFLDVVAGTLSLPISIWVAVACMVGRACGYPIPFIG